MNQTPIEQLQSQIDDLARRVSTLERPAMPPPEPAPPPPPPPAWRPAPPPKPARTMRELLGVPADASVEDLLGGRVLAWVGGVAVLLGIVFLFAVAISHGWIGEGARTALGALVSAGLLALGIWLHERKARTDAALACVATGVAGLFVTVTVATQVYELVPSVPGTMLAVLAGAVAAALAVRWEARGIAALGIVGALAAPLLAGAGHDAGSMAILLVAFAAAGGVLVWQRWGWLALAAFGISAPQWIAHLFDGASSAGAIATLVAFGVVGVVVAVGYDLRVRPGKLRSQAAFLLALNALVLGGAGWFALNEMGQPSAGKLWLAGLALAHIAIGLGGLRRARISHELGVLSLALGVLLADVAYGLVADGAALAIGWTAAATGFAAVLRHVRRDGSDEAIAGIGLGSHVALALVTTLTVDDPLQVLAGQGTLSAACAASVAALAAGCIVSARLAEERSPEWRVALDAVGLGAVALLTALALDGQVLVLAWVAEVIALTAVARRRQDPVAGLGALAFLVLAAIHALAFEAPPLSLVTGLADPVAAIVALGAVAAAALLAGEGAGGLHGSVAAGLRTGAAVILLYLASGLIVTPFESGSAVDSALLSAHQQGQMVLSVFWALVGVGTLVVGLRRDLRALRLAALTLLGVAVAKVFLFDLATLTSLYRVVSFVGLGMLLLVAAYVWQRLRPRALPDLRETPDGLR